MGKIHPVPQAVSIRNKMAQQALEQPASSGSKPPVTTTSTQDVHSDNSALFRAALNPSPETGLASSHLLAGFGPPCAGTTTATNALQAVFGVYRAATGFQEARRVGDTGGKVHGAINGVASFAQGVGGAAYIGVRGATIASVLRPTDALAKAVAATAGSIGNVCFGLLYFCMLVDSVPKWVKSREFNAGLRSAQAAGPEAAMEFLEKQLTLGSDRLEAMKKASKYLTSAERETFNKPLEDAALDALTPRFLEAQKALGGASLSYTEARQAIKEMLDKEPRHGKLSALAVLGIQIEDTKEREKKEAQLARKMGGSPDGIKKALASGLRERLEAQDEIVKKVATDEANKLLTSVASDAVKNQWLLALCVVVSLLGVFTFVMVPVLIALAPLLPALVPLALALTTGVGAKVVFGSLLGGYVLMLGLDAYIEKKGLSSKGPVGKYDRLYLGAIGSIAVGSFVLAAALTAAVALPAISLVGGGIIAGLGVLKVGHSYRCINLKEKQWEKEHPRLKQLQAVLGGGSSALDSAQKDLFNLLSEEDRAAVRNKYFEKKPHFKNHRYSGMQAGGRSFAEGYLASHHKALDEMRWLVDAAKEATEMCWKEESKQAALAMQAVHDRIVQEAANARAPDGMQRAIKALKKHKSAYKKFEASIWYTVKLCENQKDLKTVLGEVLAERAGPGHAENTAAAGLVSEVFAARNPSALVAAVA